MFLSTLLASSAKWYPVLFDTPMNIARSVAIWLTLALLIAFVVCACVLKDEVRTKFLKISLISAIVYACVLGIMFLTFTFIEDGIQLLLFLPILILILAVAACALTLVFKRNKLTYIVCGCIACAALVAVLVCIGVYYEQNVKDDGYYNSDVASVNQLVLYLVSVLLIGAVVAIGFLFDNGKPGFDAKSIAYASVCIALSFALSYLRIVKMPQGGSVTIASLLPLMIYSYMFGTKKGVFAGLVYGTLQAVQDPWIIHPAQFLLDYPIAFSAIGVAGMFAKVKKLDRIPQLQFALGAVVASVLRFICHVLSGVFAFSAYAVDAGMNVWAYSTAYNSFVFIDIAIVLVAGVLVFSSPTVVNQMRRFHVSAKPQEVQSETEEQSV